MKRQSFENRIATIIDAVKKASPKDSSIGIPRTGRGDALDLLVDAIEDLQRRLRENVTAFRRAEEAMVKMQSTSEKRVEGRLSGERLLLMDALEENIPDTIYFKDAQGRFMHISRAHARLFNLKDPTEAIGKTDFDFFTKEHARATFEDEQRIIRTGEPLVNKEEKETRLGRPDRWILTTKMPLRDQQGNIVGTFGISRDITERKQAEDALRESEQRLSDIIDFLPDATFAIDREGRVIAWNRAIEEMTGVAAGEMVGRDNYEYALPFYGMRRPTLIDLVGKPDLDAAKDYHPILMKGKGLLIAETWVTHLRSSGAFVWAKATLLYDRKGNATGAIESIRDITEQKRAEEKLLASEERYRSLVENLGEGIMMVDPQETIVFANPVAETIFGGTAVEITGRNLREHLSSENYAAILRETEKRRRGATSRYETEIIRPDGTVRRVRVTATPQTDGNDFFVGTLLLLLDLTELRKTEEALRKAEEQLQQARKLEAVGRLAGGIAHDFNNILTVIDGYADLTEACLPAGTPLRGNVGEIRTAAGRATRLTTQLLAFSRKQVLQPRVISVNEVVQGMKNMLARLVGEDVMLQTFLPPEVGNIMADPVQVEQVMMNLAANARDAMPNGGKLTVETANCALGDAYVHEHPEVAAGEYVMLAVSDTGEGMDQETLSRVFEPFFTTKEMGKGTGLGLATVYGIVKQSGGYIFCYSEKGTGTSFRVYFPRVTEDRTVETPRPAGTKPLLGTETVLLVEDERAIRKFVGIALRNAGYVVREAQDGPAALAEASSGRGPIHLLLTDVVMPRMNGPELARRIREIHPYVRILYMSGYTANSIVHRGILDADLDMLQKPFTAGGLLEKVREVLDR